MPWWLPRGLWWIAQVATYAPEEWELLTGVVGMLMACGATNRGELGTDMSERREAVSGSTSDMEPFLHFLLVPLALLLPPDVENALLKELLN